METDLVKLIEDFRDKASDWETMQSADEILLKKLKILLHVDEYVELLIAYGDCIIGKGNEEFYRVCNELIAKYSNRIKHN